MAIDIYMYFMDIFVVFVAGATYSNYSSLHSKLSRYPTLLTSACHVDLYQQWTHDALVTIADFWLRDPTEQVRHDALVTIADFWL